MEIDPFKRKIKSIHDILWHDFNRSGPNKLAEAREVYEVVKKELFDSIDKMTDELFDENSKRVIKTTSFQE